jgi:iron complex outermembrane receptor protein
MRAPLGHLFLFGALLLPASLHAQDAADLKRLSIEELMLIDVTTAARRPEPVGSTAGAVTVATSDDIRRSGVTTIADALRLVTGVHVAQTSGAVWNLTARGFNQATANKLLVMVDGRTVYSPLFTGVFWNVIDYVLEDIERIEVIRGPGATLWGANAVNGVINIITRHTRSTRGTYLMASAGTEDRANLTVRYGGGTGADDGFSWRVYGKVADSDAQAFASGLPSRDDRTRGQVGFRIDAGNPERTAWMFKGDAFHSADGFINGSRGAFTEVDVQGQVTRALSPGSQVSLQSYYRREMRRQEGQFAHHIDIGDVDAQHDIRVGDRNAVVWGGGVRVNADSSEGTPALSLSPASRRHGLASVFVQDEIAVVPGRWYVTPGTKWEYNSFSGGSFQPSIRTRVTVPHGQLWGAASRANRRPSRLEDDLIILGADGSPTIVGSDSFLPERLLALEGGYRVQPRAELAVDATIFRHTFKDLRSLDLPASPPGPLVLGNSLEGRSHGVELTVNLQPVRWWRTSAGYTWLDTSVTATPGSRAVSAGTSEANDPNHLFGLRTSIDLPRDVDFDASIRSVGRLSTPVVPAYTSLDLRVGWNASRQIELFFAGHDLLDARHAEFGAPGPLRVEVERSIRVGITVRH